MRSDRLRVVSGNAFATLVVVRAYAADGSELGGWSLGDSDDVSVTAVSRYGRRVMEHEIVADTALRVNCIRVEWPADMAVCEWGLEITGTHDGRVWRSMEPGVVTIVRTNPEACIPENSIIASDYYRVVQELRVVGSGGVQSDWEETNPDAGGYIRNKPVLADVATSGAYDDLSGKPVIPTRVGQLTNDAGYVTSSTLSGYATKGEMTEAEVAIGLLSDKVDGFDESIEGLEESVASLESGKADVNHTHPHTSITDWDAATAAFLTTTTASATYLSKTDAAATYATKASVPTKTSDLTNDSGYITTASLSGYATQEWVQDAWDAYDQEYHMTTAYATATAAASAAAAADTKATNAATAAATANTTATAAQTSAHAAQTRADNAYTLANTANTTANAALPASAIWSGTQAQYDALTAAQKAAVIAFIEEE